MRETEMARKGGEEKMSVGIERERERERGERKMNTERVEAGRERKRDRGEREGE